MASGKVEGSDPRLVVDQRGGNLALDLFVLDQHLTALMVAVLAGTGVPPAQYAVYGQLADQPRRPSDLAAALGVPAPTLSGYLGAMESRGHLVRERNDADRRSFVVRLTEEGQRVRGECQLRVRRAVTALNSAVGSAADVRAMREVLGRLDGAVRAASARLGS